MTQRKNLGRRKFLRIIGAGSIAGLTALKLGIDAVPKTEVVSETRFLMGTLVNLTLVTADRMAGKDALEACLGHMENLETVLSRHQSESQLSCLNRDGELENASPHLTYVLNEAVRYGTLTGGAFDVTVKPLVDLYNANHTSGNGLPSDAAIQRTLTQVGYQHIRVDRNTVSYEQPEMAITLDSIAKGYIVDQGIAALQQHGFRNILVEAGGDLSAMGSKSGNTPWRIGIQSPRNDQDSLLPSFNIRNQAVATSGDYMQAFTPDFAHHHILDPRTGYSAPELSSVTLVAPNVMLADALATAVMVMGTTDGLNLIENMPGCEAIVLTKTLEVMQSSGFRL